MTDGHESIGVSANTPWTIRRIIEWTTSHLEKHGSETPRLDTEILLAHACRCQRIELYTRFDDIVGEHQRTLMRELVRRRVDAEPVAYLVGHREFFGLDFRVTPDVLIPRPDTETLVVELLELCKERNLPRILDVGTGCGCIAIAAAVNLPSAQVTATDISRAAVEVARENAAAHNVADRIRFLQGDLFHPLGTSEQFEIIASNPPYVAQRELATLQDDVRNHEPHIALDGGADGLDHIRRLVAEAPAYLAPGGQLIFEVSPEQQGVVDELLCVDAAYTHSGKVQDLSGKVRLFRAQTGP